MAKKRAKISEGEVLSVLLLATTLFWTCVKIAKALKDFHEED